MNLVFERASDFCSRFGLRVPILLAPMAGACPPSLSAAVANAGGLGAAGVFMLQPSEIIAWTSAVRAQSNGACQLNNGSPTRRGARFRPRSGGAGVSRPLRPVRAARGRRRCADRFCRAMRGDARRKSADNGRGRSSPSAHSNLGSCRRCLHLGDCRPRLLRLRHDRLDLGRLGRIERQARWAGTVAAAAGDPLA